MTKKITNAKIACLDFSLNKEKMKLGIQVLVNDPSKLEAIRQREADITKVVIIEEPGIWVALQITFFVGALMFDLLSLIGFLNMISEILYENRSQDSKCHPSVLSVSFSPNHLRK